MIQISQFRTPFRFRINFLKLNIKFLFPTLLIVLWLVASTAFADTDITTSYLTNPGFNIATSSSYVSGATTNLTTSTDATSMLAVSGWTAAPGTNSRCAADVEYGFAGKINNVAMYTSTLPDGLPAGTTGVSNQGSLATSGGWGTDVIYYQRVTLPAGTYKVETKYYNGGTATGGISKFGFAASAGSETPVVTGSMSGTAYFTMASWTTDVVTFTLNNTTTGYIQVGFTAGSGGSANSAKLFWDYVKIYNITYLNNGQTGDIFGRLSEGTSSGDGTFLGVKGYATTPVNCKSFGIEHHFYGQTNSSINFFRGTGITGGFITFSTNNNDEKMRIDPNGNVGIGVLIPSAKLDVTGNAKISSNLSIGDYVDVNSTSNGKVQLAMSACSGCYANGAIAGDGVLRQLGGTNNLILSIANNINDGNSYIGINDEANGLWCKFQNNREMRVNGKIYANEVQVVTNVWADKVFAPDYKLKSLSEISSYIDANKHLPDVPSENEAKANGVNLAQMNVLLLQKVEELTLHMIEQQKAIEAQSAQIKELKKELHK